jgi:hypothetical protein
MTMGKPPYPQMKTNKNAQLICVWTSPVATVMWVVGFLLLAGFVPPLSPDLPAAQIKAYYVDHKTLILLGMAVTMMGSALIGPFVAVISIQMKRIEGYYSPFASTQLGLGMLVILLFVLPCFYMAAGAYRVERDAELVLLMNDIGWMPFVGGFQTTFIQLIVIGLCILMNPGQKVFPRWLGFYSIWSAVLLLPTGMILFFKTGPFAWDGMLAFWLALVDFCGWYLTMFWQTRKAILQQAREEGE